MSMSFKVISVALDQQQESSLKRKLYVGLQLPQNRVNASNDYTNKTLK